MHMETTMIVVWVAAPLIAYAAGLGALARLGHRQLQPELDAAHRLEELRRRQAEGRRVTRGRLSEARRLAESDQPSPSKVTSPVVP